jgi:FADH2 O2-dependent halogenase
MMTETDSAAAYDCDVVITGQNLGTQMLAAILARHGISVTLVPTAADGDWPVGETTVPEAAELFFLIGSRLQLPEIEAMGMFADLPAELRARCGVKRNLGFLYHRPGEQHDTSEAVQFMVPSEHAEWHVCRPAVEEYLGGVATRYGAEVAPEPAAGCPPRITADAVAVQLTGGRTVRARYLVDGSGDDRLLPPGDAARRRPGRHRASLITASLLNVEPFESVVPTAKYGGDATPWSLGTLTHTVGEGWLQVVPFGNHPAAENRSVSVVASLDPRYIDDDLEPEKEFDRIIDRYPQLRRQFAGTVEAGPWRRYVDWPGLLPECTGPRWFRFDRTAGRNDVILSRDLVTTLALVHAVGAALVGMASVGSWAGDGMAPLGRFQATLLDSEDRMMAAARTAAGSFPLWNAFLRVWLLRTILAALSIKRARLDGESGFGAARWSPVERFADGPYWYRVPAGLPELVDDALTSIEQVAAGRLDADRAASRLFGRLRKERFVPPLYAFGDPGARYYAFSRARRLRMLWWTKTTAPADFRRLLTMDNITAVPDRRTG